MKQGTTSLLTAAMVLASAGVLDAQPLPPLDGPTIHYGTRAYYGRIGPPIYAPPPAMPPYEAAAILRSHGYRPLSRPVRRGGFYIVSATHRNGDGRVVIDAYTGELVRFIPAGPRIRRGGDEMVLVYQGPTFPPPDLARFRRGPPRAERNAPRPPAPVPRVASRAPAEAPLVTPKPRPKSAPQEPETAQAPPAPAPVETKPAADSPKLSPKPIGKTPDKPVVLPTQPMPPVQTME